MRNAVWIIGLLALIGCSDGENRSEKEAAREIVNNVSGLTQACIRIGKCLGAKVKLIHFANQPHAPYACDVTVDKKRQVYLYPDAKVSFGSVDGFMFDNAQTVCELATKSGEYSDATIEANRKRYERWKKERNEKAKPREIPTLPIEEHR